MLGGGRRRRLREPGREGQPDDAEERERPEDVDRCDAKDRDHGEDDGDDAAVREAVEPGDAVRVAEGGEGGARCGHCAADSGAAGEQARNRDARGGNERRRSEGRQAQRETGAGDGVPVGPGAPRCDGEPDDGGQQEHPRDDPPRGQEGEASSVLERGDHVGRQVDAEVAGDADEEGRGRGAQAHWQAGIGGCEGHDGSIANGISF
ncbi:hypothetical protein GCM10008096_09280 [Zhihengliuella salsuginis]|uniref:Uncharacterized protein n=1 Tax=Zhihengliuella salsuginis TaxID=578222 RepID=A0ABQ3GFX8_9MICC|nr:hypothetical protein GCM10008096_09280 [Zhihengliuella salsuginis]